MTSSSLKIVGQCCGQFEDPAPVEGVEPVESNFGSGCDVLVPRQYHNPAGLNLLFELLH